jgi:ribosomal protein L31
MECIYALKQDCHPKYLQMEKQQFAISSTYDHRTLRIMLPVCSATYKQCTGGLVVRWVTTSESPLLYVLHFFAAGGEGCDVGVVEMRGRKE